MKKKLGIIGGMGPAATVMMFHKLVSMSDAAKDQEHLEIFIHNNTNIPDRTRSILNGGPSPLDEMYRSAKILEKMGAELLLFPCMTAHYYIRELQRLISIPILNAIEDSISFITIHYPHVNHIGILATSGTIRSRIFQLAIEHVGRHALTLPSDLQEEWVMSAIYGKKGIKAGYKNFQVKQQLKKAGDYLISHGAEVVITGCTEIPIVLEQSLFQVPLIDPMDILSQKAIQLCGGKCRFTT